LKGADLKKRVVREVMGGAFPVVSAASTIDQITGCITRDCPAVFVELGGGRYDILTKEDLLQALARRAERSH